LGCAKNETMIDARVQLVRFELSITLGLSQTKSFPFLLVQVSKWLIITPPGSIEVTRQLFFDRKLTLVVLGHFYLLPLIY
jgi:hypothetical protein